MNDNSVKNNNIFKQLRAYFFENIRNILIILSILIISLISFQIYNYISIKQLKNTSINFFNSIEDNNEIIEELNRIKKQDNIYSTLSTLKIIENNNKTNEFGLSNDLYRDLVSSNKLNDLYKSSVAVHAAYTLINASYLENTNIYIDDISYFIENIENKIESYFSIKKELEYLLIVTKININNIEYKNNNNAIDKYNEILNSSLISSSVKERVKKIHEFHLYK